VSECGGGTTHTLDARGRVCPVFQDEYKVFASTALFAQTGGCDRALHIFALFAAAGWAAPRYFPLCTVLDSLPEAQLALLSGKGDEGFRPFLETLFQASDQWPWIARGQRGSAWRTTAVTGWMLRFRIEPTGLGLPRKGGETGLLTEGNELVGTRMRWAPFWGFVSMSLM
jgi:hypothetical protein